jgi:HSP20 family protein
MGGDENEVRRLMAKPRAPWNELGSLQERLGRLLEEALLGGGDLPPGEAAASWRPLVDLVETADAFVLYAELPGVAKQDVTVESDGRSLDLSGQRRPPEHAFLRLEGSWGPFRRRLELPEAVDSDGIEARFRRGILEVILPKRREAEAGAMQVPVKEG